MLPLEKAPRVVVVADPGDDLARGVLERLDARGTSTRWVLPKALSLLPLELDADRGFFIKGEPILAVLWRASVHHSFSDGFMADDRGFSDSETLAVWLAAMQLPQVLSINRFDATAWYAGLNWPHWHSFLSRQGVTTVPLVLGDCDGEARRDWSWHPYTGLERLRLPDRLARRFLGTAAAPQAHYGRHLFVRGVPVTEGTVVPNVRRAVELLTQAGVSLVGIEVDDSGHIASVDVLPTVEAPHHSRASELLAELIHAHCCVG